MLIECQNRERQRPDQRSNLGKRKAKSCRFLSKTRGDSGRYRSRFRHLLIVAAKIRTAASAPIESIVGHRLDR